jgi:hypothetical protein
MMNRSWDYRHHKRYVKGIKRIREDRAEHGDDHSCPCFFSDAQKGRGVIFSRFADTPAPCSNPWCCGNSDEPWEKNHVVPNE